ncbi:MAG TPA: hypothetical protein VN310_08470 [Candidatus Dormibacteraeota bacterium]|nr:hypothetical protein [Candidatus Dormibacteraeota bacterium]
MSIAAVSNPLLTQAQQYFQTRRADLQQLGKALENGNLASAQTAYKNIVKLGKSGPFAGGNPFIPQREQEFQAIGKALHAGDLAGAQQAFARARGTAEPQSDGGGPGGTLAQPAPKTAASGPEIILNLSNSSGSSASPEQITINISPTKGGGEQVAFSIGSQGSTPEQVTLNLAANSNEQIVLNLLGAAPSPSGASGSTARGSAASGGLSVTA